MACYGTTAIGDYIRHNGRNFRVVDINDNEEGDRRIVTTSLTFLESEIDQTDILLESEVEVW